MRKYFDKYTLAGAVLAFIAWLYLAPTATVAGIIQAIVPAAVPAAFKNGVGGTKFQLSDNSGNINTAGSITSGSGSGVGGVIDLTQGTAPSFSAANTFSLYAPTSIPTSYQWQVPSADGSGCIQSNGSGVLSITTCGGGGGTSAGATLFSGTSTATVTAASATTLIGTVTGSTTVPANTWTAGSLTEIYATGYYTTPAAARTLTINLNIGGSTRITTGAVTVIASVTNGTWNLHCGITTRTTGASGTQIGNCTFFMTGTTSTPAGFPMQTSSTWTMDTTAGKAIDLQAAWDATTGSPTISCSNVAAWIPGAPVTSVNGSTGAVTVQTVGPGASAYNSGAQSLTNSADNYLTFDTNKWDTGSIHSTSVNTSRFTAPTTGFYLAICSVTLASNAQFSFSIRVNRTVADSYAAQTIPQGTFGQANATVSQMLSMTAGDFMECDAFPNSGVSTVAKDSFGQLTKMSSSF